MFRALLALSMLPILGLISGPAPAPGLSGLPRPAPNGTVVAYSAAGSFSGAVRGGGDSRGVSSAAAASLTGRVSYGGPESASVVVALYRLPVFGNRGPERLSKEDVLGGREPSRTVVLPGPGEFSFQEVDAGHYSVLAFMDLDGDRRLGFDPPEPLGWHTAEAGGWIDEVDLSSGSRTGVELTLRTPTPFPKEERQVENGAFRWMKGLPVLQLQGNPEERGYAHGSLVGPQIMDFFEFYVLEDSWRSADRYESEFVPFLESHFFYDPEYLTEADAVIRGMRESGMDMEVQSLGRDFRRVDLLAINAYIERRAARPSPPPPGGTGSTRPLPEGSTSDGFVGRVPLVPLDLSELLASAGPACSQFAFWGEATADSELSGGLIAGRNMDGEVDLRKVTVSHFLIFAVDPADEGRYRWISTMWPGFIGTISGINEAGLYSMENAGGTGPGPVVDGLTPCTWTQRDILERAGAESTPESIARHMDRFRSNGGGAFGAGSIILWAVPFQGQTSPAFVAEGDRFGTAVREPTEVAPTSPFNIMATNHYLTYGVEAGRPGFYFGKEASFSSRWRYEAGQNTLESWERQGKALGTKEMRRLLQSVAHGTTEYSVIFRPNEMTVDVAVDDLATDLWDAPYQEWVTFRFDELFQGMR